MRNNLFLTGRPAGSPVLVSALAIVLCCFPHVCDAQIRLCNWGAKGNLPARHGGNQFVEWGSLADEAGADSYNISNYVINVDRSGARNIDWEVGSMRVDALRPDHIAYVCEENTSGRFDRHGPLYFARDRSAVSTHVYAGRLPPPTQIVGQIPLKLDSQFIVAGDASKGGTATLLRVRVSTELTKTDKGYEIRYVLTNLSPSDAIVDLPLDAETLKEFGDGQILLKKGATRTAKVISSEFPPAIRFPVRIQESSQKGTSAVVLMPTRRKPPAAPQPPVRGR